MKKISLRQSAVSGGQRLRGPAGTPRPEKGKPAPLPAAPVRSLPLERLSELADVAPMLVWVTDPQGRFVFLNGTWKEFTGRDPRTLSGDGWLETLHPDDRASAAQVFSSALTARQPFKVECRFRDTAGDIRHVALTATPQFQGETFTGYLGTGVDVSLRRRNQEALRESESRYRELAESIGHLFCALDRDLRFTYWNSACEILLGLPATSVVGRRADEIFPAYRTSPLSGLVEKVLQSGESATTEYEVHVGQGITPFEVFLFPTRGGLSVIARDISERKNSERALRASEAKYRNIFESANDAIVIFEPRTEKVLEANSRALQLYGFSRDEFIGMGLKRLTMDIARGEQQIERALELGSISDFETVQFRKDGTPMTLVINAAAIDYKGQQAILAVCRDVSHILSVEEVLKSQDNVLQRLLASSDDIVFMQDKEGGYLFYNGSPRFTLSTDAVRGKTPYDFYPPAVARRMMERLYQVIATGRSVSAETQFEWQGESVWFLDQLSPVRNSSGDVVSIVTISRNITERKKSEERLRRSEERYRAFIEQSADGIWRLEMVRPIPVDTPVEEQIRLIFEFGYLAECNDVMVRMLGHEMQESVIGTPLGTIVPPDDEQSLDGLRRFIQADYRLAESEVRIAGSGGTVRYYSNTFTGIVEQGRLVRIWGSRADITERKQVEREMHLIAQTITSTKDCVSITDLDERILFVNHAFLETHGYAEEDLLGKPLSLVRSPSMAGELARQILPSTLHGGWYGEVLHRRKDGKDLPLELWISVVRNDEGDPVALVGVARDVSERKRMEQALRKSENRLRRITDAMRDVIVQTDAEGIVQYMSPSGLVMLGYRADEALGRSLFEKVHPEDREATQQRFQSALAEGRGMSLEFRYHHAAGHYIWLEAVGALMSDDHHVGGAVLVLRDIGERKLTEERLLGTLREKEVMVKEIHHRVKNNLQVISSLLSLQSEYITDESIRRVLRDSQNRVRSMAIIHQRLYRSSNLAEVNLAGYADELCAQLFRSYGAFSRDIHLQVKAEEVFLSVDVAIPCGIILNELVSNALKYAYPSDTGGTVTVEIQRTAVGVRMEVRDDGVGMPEHLDLNTTESLGLRLVSMLAEQIGAEVKVGPGPEGADGRRGTAWALIFPIQG